MGGLGLTWGRAGIRQQEIGDVFQREEYIEKQEKQVYSGKLQVIQHFKVQGIREKMIGNEAEKRYRGQTMKYLIYHAKKFDL